MHDLKKMLIANNFQQTTVLPAHIVLKVVLDQAL